MKETINYKNLHYFWAVAFSKKTVEVPSATDTALALGVFSLPIGGILLL